MITKTKAQIIGKKIGVDFNHINLEQFRQGIEVESEHKDVVGTNPATWGKIAIAHLKEVPDYYDRLKIVEHPDSYKYKKYTKELKGEIDRLKKRGYVIKIVSQRTLGDFAAMNYHAAKRLGFPWGDRPHNELLINPHAYAHYTNEDEFCDVHHEGEEDQKLKKNPKMKYWPAHRESLRDEPINRQPSDDESYFNYSEKPEAEVITIKTHKPEKKKSIVRRIIKRIKIS